MADEVQPMGADVLSSSAHETSRVFYPYAGTLVACFGYHVNAGARWIQIHDATALPANGTVPKISIHVAAASSFTVPIPISGITFSNGIVAALSTTGPTLTIGVAEAFFHAVII